jgi:uncharacterized membrane protein YgcG
MRSLVRRVLLASSIVAAVFALFLAVPAGASAQAGSERIVTYDASIDIQRDGSVLITEQILYDFGSAQRHGIIREIPVRSAYDSGHDRIFAVDVRSVRSPDAPGQYTVEDNGSSVRIRIGDPGLTVTGEHMYIITYLVRGGLNGFADHDELYWNAVGNQWDVPIGRADVQVTAPAAVTRAACYAGPLGSTRSCQTAGISGGVARFAQAGLAPHEGLTVVVAIPKGVVSVPRPVLRERWTLQRAFAATPVSAGTAGGLLAVLLILGAVLLARGRDPRHARFAAHLSGGAPAKADGRVQHSGHDEAPLETAPPAEVRPGQAGTLLDGAANPRDVTGTIADLAVRGYLRIEDPGSEPGQGDVIAGLQIAGARDWRLVRLEKAGGLLDYEQILLDGLFEGAATHSGGPSVRLSDLGVDFAGPLAQAQDALYKDMVAQGWFTVRPDRVRHRWLTVGVALFIAGAAATTVLAAVSDLALMPVPVALAGLLLIGCASRMPARTAKGASLARQLLRFRRYMATAAAGQTHPGGQPRALDGYLPYAIAFGCTKEWAEVTAALEGADQAPAWFRSRQPYSPGTLASMSRSGHYFSSMHYFAMNTSNWIASRTQAAPASEFLGGPASRSGFFGGFSGGGGGGGGFSGGGGGGGGGGSW